MRLADWLGGEDAFTSQVTRNIQGLIDLLAQLESDDYFLNIAPTHENELISLSIQRLQRYAERPYAHRSAIHQHACYVAIALTYRISVLDGTDAKSCEDRRYRDPACISEVQSIIDRRIPDEHRAPVTTLCFATPRG